jgi:hypothetical protein
LGNRRSPPVVFRVTRFFLGFLQLLFEFSLNIQEFRGLGFSFSRSNFRIVALPSRD